MYVVDGTIKVLCLNVDGWRSRRRGEECDFGAYREAANEGGKIVRLTKESSFVNANKIKRATQTLAPILKLRFALRGLAQLQYTRAKRVGSKKFWRTGTSRLNYDIPDFRDFK